MKYFLFILLITLISCSPEKGKLRQAHYNYSVDQLNAEKGTPHKTSKNYLDENYEMYHYDDDEVYQVSGNKVIAKFRNAKNHEKNIQYWRHLLSGVYYKIEKDTKSKTHSPNNILRCPSKGLTIYFNSSGFVLRVGESMGGKGGK